MRLSIADIFTAPATFKTQRYFYIITSLLILLFAILYLYLLYPLSFILDDTYIIIHNIQALISGYDINYPGVSALDGATSLVYLALVRFFACFVSPLWAVYIITWLSILIYALGLLRLAFIYAASNLQAVMFLISGFLIGFTLLNLLNGLETGLAFAMLVWTIIFIILEINTAKNISGNILLGLLPFVRPELILFTFILWSSRGFYYWREQKNLKYLCIQLIKDLFIISLTALPFALWYFIALGMPYPQTLDAKKYFFAEQNYPTSAKSFVAFSNLYNFGRTLGVINFIIILSLMLFTPLSRIFLLFFIVFFLLYLFIFPTALCYNNYRYLYLWIPLMLYGIIACNKHPNYAVRLFSYIFLVLLFINSIFNFPIRWKNYLNLYHEVSTEHVLLKTWCEKNISSNNIILIQDAGYLAYATDFHLIDFVGLKTPENIRFHQTLTFPSNGQKRAEAIAHIIRQSHPQYLMITQDWNNRFHITEGLKQQGVKLQKMPISNEYIAYKIN
jgi:hypothetical protein